MSDQLMTTIAAHTSTDEVGSCGQCGARFARTYPEKRYCGRLCQRRAAAQRSAANRRTHQLTARSLNHHGYFVGKVWRDDRKVTVLEHRWVLEQHLGRRLASGESVHHVNGIRTDNRIENLRLYSSISDHLEAEHRPRRRGADDEAVAATAV